MELSINGYDEIGLFKKMDFQIDDCSLRKEQNIGKAQFWYHNAVNEQMVS